MKRTELKPTDPRRELGVIESVSIPATGNSDPREQTVFVFWKAAFGSSGQGFGGLYLPAKANRDLFIREVGKIFGIKNAKTEDLVGKSVFALRVGGGWGDVIEGLESVETGRIITLDTFRKALDPGYKIPNLRTQEIDDAVRSVTVAEERLAEAKRNLERVVASVEYINWNEEAANAER